MIFLKSNKLTESIVNISKGSAYEVMLNLNIVIATRRNFRFMMQIYLKWKLGEIGRFEF